MGSSTKASDATLDVAGRVMAAIMDGPVTEYGLPAKAGICGCSRFDTGRRWLACLEKNGVIRKTGRMLPNPNGAAKGEHPVYELNL